MGRLKSINPAYVKTLREGKNLSQRELADIVDVDQTVVSAWERGKASPTLEKREKLAELFGVSVESFSELEATSEPALSEDSIRRVVRQEIQYVCEREFQDLKKLTSSILGDDIGLAALRPLLEQIAQAAPASAPRRGKPELHVEPVTLDLTVPDPPAHLVKEDRRRWLHNAETLRRWAETNTAARDFPHGVPGWAVERFCREVVNFYEGGKLADVSGVLWDFIREGH